MTTEPQQSTETTEIQSTPISPSERFEQLLADPPPIDGFKPQFDTIAKATPTELSAVRFLTELMSLHPNLEVGIFPIIIYLEASTITDNFNDPELRRKWRAQTMAMLSEEDGQLSETDKQLFISEMANHPRTMVREIASADSTYPYRDTFNALFKSNRMSKRNRQGLMITAIAMLGMFPEEINAIDPNRQPTLSDTLTSLGTLAKNLQAKHSQHSTESDTHTVEFMNEVALTCAHLLGWRQDRQAP